MQQSSVVSLTNIIFLMSYFHVHISCIAKYRDNLVSFFYLLECTSLLNCQLQLLIILAGVFLNCMS